MFLGKEIRLSRLLNRKSGRMLAITVEGIDHINSEHQRKTTTMLLMDRSHENDDLD